MVEFHAIRRGLTYADDTPYNQLQIPNLVGDATLRGSGSGPLPAAAERHQGRASEDRVRRRSLGVVWVTTGG